MFNLQGSEIIVILLLALVVLGPEKLPDAIRKFTQTYNEFKKMSSGFQSELKSALDEPMREMRETANLVRDAADPRKIIAEAEAEQRLRDETKQPTSDTADDPDDTATPADGATDATDDPTDDATDDVIGDTADDVIGDTTDDAIGDQADLDGTDERPAE